jgi:hypothetical protein
MTELHPFRPSFIVSLPRILIVIIEPVTVDVLTDSRSCEGSFNCNSNYLEMLHHEMAGSIGLTWPMHIHIVFTGAFLFEHERSKLSVLARQITTDHHFNVGMMFPNNWDLLMPIEWALTSPGIPRNITNNRFYYCN